MPSTLHPLCVPGARLESPLSLSNLSTQYLPQHQPRFVRNSLSAGTVPWMGTTAWEVLPGAQAHRSCLRISEQRIGLCTKDWRH